MKTNWMWNMAALRIELQLVMVIRHFLHHVAFVYIMWV
jgi:hypothetical protein